MIKYLQVKKIFYQKIFLSIKYNVNVLYESLNFTYLKFKNIHKIHKFCNEKSFDLFKCTLLVMLNVLDKVKFQIFVSCQEYTRLTS